MSRSNTLWFTCAAVLVAAGAIAACGTDSGGTGGDTDGGGGQDAGRDVTTEDAPTEDAPATDAPAEDASDAGDGASQGAVTHVSAGELFACALRADGSVWCWGSNQYGELGSPPSASDACNDGRHCSEKPVRVPGLADVVAVSAGSEFACAIKKDDSVWCWGKNDFGQLGHEPAADALACGDRTDAGTRSPCGPTPTKVKLPDGIKPVQVTTGWVDTCIRTAGSGGAAGGDVYCWGNNVRDTAGRYNDAGAVIPTPTKIQGFSGDVVDVRLALGTRHACAAKADGTAWCWGDDFQGRLGIPEGNGVDCPDPVVGPHCTPVPVQVRVLASADAGGDGGVGQPLDGVVSVRVGSGASCALLKDGTVACWGSNGWASLGNDGPFAASISNPGARAIPGLASVQRLERRYSTSFAIDANRATWVWGENSFGMSGNGTRDGVTCPVGADGGNGADGGTCITPPAKVAGLTDLQDLSPGQYFTVAIKADGTVWSWGRNEAGQLGHAAMTSGDALCVETRYDLGAPFTDSAPCNPTPSQVAFP